MLFCKAPLFSKVTPKSCLRGFTACYRDHCSILVYTRVYYRILYTVLPIVNVILGLLKETILDNMCRIIPQSIYLQWLRTKSSDHLQNSQASCSLSNHDDSLPTEYGRLQNLAPLFRYLSLSKKNHPSSDENAQELMVFGCFWVPRHSKYPDTEMVCKTTIYSRSIQYM